MKPPSIVICQYICNSCGSKRTINIDEHVHQSRRDLNTQGLASYIDIHAIPNNREQAEHGVRLFIDSNFVVRSNDEIKVNITSQRQNGPPVPSLTPSRHTYSVNLTACHSFELISKIHNLHIIIENSSGNRDEETHLLSLKSDFNTVTMNLSYLPSKIPPESIVFLIEWGKILLRWVEFTGRLQHVFLPSILKIIDQNYVRPPTVTDELFLSIVLDAHSTIFPHSTDIDLDKILRNSVITLPAFDENESFKDMTGVCMDVFKFVSNKLQEGKYIDLSSLDEEICALAPPEKAFAYRNSLVLLLIDLIRFDVIGFSVSYLQ